MNAKELLQEIQKRIEVTPENEQCPVCGYYCLGKGGIGCIDKPALCGIEMGYRGDDSKEMNAKELIEEIDRHIAMVTRPEFKVFASNSEERVTGIIAGLRMAKDIVETARAEK